MKIHASEQVKRFNAQVELVDIALDFAADKLTDPGALIRLLQLTGRRELAKTFEESMRQVCIAGAGWPTGAADPGQSPYTVFETRTRSADPISFLSQEIVEDLEREICGRETAWSDIELIAVAERLIRRSDLCREYDEMRTTLKQSRKAIIACVKSMRDAQFIPLEKTLSEAMDRINAIIPASEV